MGRPSKYREEFCEKLIEHMEEGLSYESFAGVCRVGVSTLYTWTDKENGAFHPEFLEAKSEAEALSLLFWERIGVKACNGTNYEIVVGADGSERLAAKPFSAPTYIYTMKCRFRKFGWNEEAQEDSKFDPPPKDPSLDD